MDRLLSIIQRLVIVAVWLVALGIIGLGVAGFVSGDIDFAFMFYWTVGGVLFGYVGTKLVNLIFNKEWAS